MTTLKRSLQASTEFSLNTLKKCNHRLHPIFTNAQNDSKTGAFGTVTEKSGLGPTERTVPIPIKIFGLGGIDSDVYAKRKHVHGICAELGCF